MVRSTVCHPNSMSHTSALPNITLPVPSTSSLTLAICTSCLPAAFTQVNSHLRAWCRAGCAINRPPCMSEISLTVPKCTAGSVSPNADAESQHTELQQEQPPHACPACSGVMCVACMSRCMPCRPDMSLSISFVRVSVITTMLCSLMSSCEATAFPNAASGIGSGKPFTFSTSS